MDLDVVPPVAPEEEQALANALLRAGLDLDEKPAGYGSAWRHAGLAEATGQADETDGYAPSPRNTRGATRA